MAKHHGHKNNHEDDLWRYTYPMIGVWVVLFLSIIGSTLPVVLIRRYPNIKILETGIFRFFNGFGAGVIIAVGFVHSFPEAAEGLSEAFPDFPWVGVLALAGAFVTFLAEQGIVFYLGIRHSHGGEVTKVQSGKEGEGKGEGEGAQEKGQRVKFYTEMWSLLFGLTFHSFFVGFTLGLESDDLGILIAIIAHQFFEAISLGVRVARAGVKRTLHILVIDLIFSLAAPVGTAVGMGVQSAVISEPKTYDVLQGVFNGFSAGILIYIGILHLMVEEIESLRSNRFHQFLAYFGLGIGASFMSVLAIWA